MASRSWALLSGHTPGNRLDRRAKPGEGGNPLCALCRVHRVLRSPRTVGRMEHRVGAVVKWFRPRRWSAGWWNVASASSRRGSAWHRMGLFGHMRIHESGIDSSTDSSIMTNPTPTSSLYDPTALPATDTNITDFTCPHCPRTFTSRIGLVGHLRIHRTETGEPVPGAPTSAHHARLDCPHCPRIFSHRMGLFGHMLIHDDLR
ncbi:hypothetical protein SprV_0702457300 [Sparganum proliferum]